MSRASSLGGGGQGRKVVRGRLWEGTCCWRLVRCRAAVSLNDDLLLLHGSVSVEQEEEEMKALLLRVDELRS